MARLSGAARRKLQGAKRGAAGVHRSHFQTSDVRTAVQDELAAQRAVIAAQRERVRHRGWAFTPGAKPEPVSVLESAGGTVPSLAKP